MLLTVNRFGSTNISLRRFTRGRRGWRLSAGGGYESGIRRNASTPKGPSLRSDSASLRRVGACALAQDAAHGEVPFAQLDFAGKPPAAADVDVEAEVAREAVLRQRRLRLFAELDARLPIAIEGVPAGAAARAVEEQQTGASVPDEAVAVEPHLRAQGGHAAAGVAAQDVLFDDETRIDRVEGVAHVLLRVELRSGDGVAAGGDHGLGDVNAHGPRVRDPVV